MAVVAPNCIGGTFDAGDRGAECKQNLHTIQLALERYSVDHDGLYPATLQPLCDEAYLPQLPRNPYDRQSGPMPELPVGAHVAGGVTYIPLHASSPADLEPGQPPGSIISYKLIGYGDRPDRKQADFHRDPHLPGAVVSQIPWEYVLMTLDGGYPGKPSLQRGD